MIPHSLTSIVHDFWSSFGLRFSVVVIKLDWNQFWILDFVIKEPFVLLAKLGILDYLVWLTWIKATRIGPTEAQQKQPEIYSAVIGYIFLETLSGQIVHRPVSDTA